MTNKSFSDLTKIDVPFGKLDINTKLALHRAHYEGKQIEGDTASCHWALVPHPTWWPTLVYRLKPEPLRDIAPPWHVMNPEIKWVARDEDDEVYGYKQKPVVRNDLWTPSDGGCFACALLAPFDHGNKPWNKSLVQRPEGV